MVFSSRTTNWLRGTPLISTSGTTVGVGGPGVAGGALDASVAPVSFSGEVVGTAVAVAGGGSVAGTAVGIGVGIAAVGAVVGGCGSAVGSTAA